VGISIATYIGFKVVTSDTSKKMIGAAQGAAENTANEIALDVERQKKALEYRAENPDAVTASDVQEPTTTDMMKELAIEAAKAELAD
jgi:predicted RNA-binding protein with PIN domain